MTIESAVQACRETGLLGWELVEYAQHLVNRGMQYSVENSFDTPEKAFEKGQGYCWHQASVLNIILRDLGFDSRLVYAVKNFFPKTEFMSVTVENFISGHVWCRVTIYGVKKDVCPANKDNSPGTIHFKPLSKVRKWGKGIEFLTYYGSALFNSHRRKKYTRLKQKQENRWNPERCSCKKTSCKRHKKCDECKEYHYAKKGLPACER